MVIPTSLCDCSRSAGSTSACNTSSNELFQDVKNSGVATASSTVRLNGKTGSREASGGRNGKKNSCCDFYGSQKAREYFVIFGHMSCFKS